MLIGLGGGAASSMDSGSNDESLDYASVQRGNPEIQRRAQEVIDRCWQLQEDNPILSIHDVGAGGLSNAFPELINDGEVGADFDIRNIDTEEKGMAPHELWCNESQERYVLAIDHQSLNLFKKICERERCPFRVIGKAKKNRHLHVKDNLLNQDVVNMELDVLLGKPPKLLKKIPKKIEKDIPKSSKINDKDLHKKVISHPSVASKKFLITIGDRSVTGLVAQDQMVGPWQTPVSNVAVTKFSFEDVTGEAFAIGERTPLAISNAKKSARMAVAEAVTNIVAANIGNITNIKLSANWMAASGDDDEDNNLFAAVHAVGEELCPQLGISIPVGKDSMSMTTKWNDKVVTSPLSLIVTAFSECENTQKTCTPEFIKQDDYIFLYIDLGLNQYRIGGSIAEQVSNTMSSECPDIDDPKLLIGFCDVIQQLINKNLIYAYHDRSDGGLFATLSEMAFASRCGIDIDLSQINAEFPNILFSEELGAVIQVNKKNEEEIVNLFREKNIQHIFNVGKINHLNQINIKHGSDCIREQRSELEKIWSLNSYHIQSIRDNAKLAAQELSLVDDNNDPGIRTDIKFELNFPSIKGTKKPQIAILREQGVNGHYEMAAAFYYAGFDAIDVHMQDLMDGNYAITDFRAFVACGGFSYGDVLGAGEGWSKVILNNPMLRDQFTSFFNQSNSIALGVCNGCQMMSNLKSIIPGADKWPKFVKNLSDQFESRVVTVKIPKNNSIFFNEMENSSIPVITAHGEGRAFFSNPNDHKEMSQKEQITLQYVTNLHEVTTNYPLNPNGSVDGVTGFTNDDGRFNIMMPHPERVFRSDQNTWSRDKNSEYGPWFKMFTNAYNYLKNS
jgi:phosphoribosylformylglycinamidine synthase